MLIRPALAFFCLCLCAFDASAQRSERQGPAGEQREQGEQQAEPRISRREASDRVRAALPGRILNITQERGGWRVRVDNEGTVFNVFVDGESGRVILPENAR